jgi:hypothetical protein
MTTTTSTATTTPITPITTMTSTVTYQRLQRPLHTQYLLLLPLGQILGSEDLTTLHLKVVIIFNVSSLFIYL